MSSTKSSCLETSVSVRLWPVRAWTSSDCNGAACALQAGLLASSLALVSQSDPDDASFGDLIAEWRLQYNEVLDVSLTDADAAWRFLENR